MSDEGYVVDVVGTLTAKGPAAFGAPEVDGNHYVDIGSGLRRLVPSECERLQGFPDGWTVPGERFPMSSEGEGVKVGSIFSGVGGFDLGLERAGHEVVFQCEGDAWRRERLAERWPGVPLSPDVKQLDRDWLEAHGIQCPDRSGSGSGVGGSDSVAVEGAGAGRTPVDLLCGGFPCQDLSVAGRRRGLAGDRSGLFYEAIRVADLLLGDGGWFLIENVPGLFSSNGGRDFGIVLASLADLGFHDVAWRVLDSRYVRVSGRPSVAQRRRRVFILARRARGRRAAEVLLEPESGGGDFTQGREARQRVAATFSKGSSGSGVSRPGRRQEDDHNIVAGALDKAGGGADDNSGQANHLVTGPGPAVSHTLTSSGFDASEDGSGRGTPIVAGGGVLGGDGSEGGEHRVRGGDESDPEVGELGRESGAVGSAAGGSAAEIDADRDGEAPRVPGGLDRAAAREDLGLDQEQRVRTFAQNTRDEVRFVGEDGAGDHVGALAAQPGAKQQNYLLVEQEEAVGIRMGQTGANGQGLSEGETNTVDSTGAGAVFGIGRRGDRCAVDPAPDANRYAAMGDAVTVNVSEWIGRRLTQYGGEK